MYQNLSKNMARTKDANLVLRPLAAISATVDPDGTTAKPVLDLGDAEFFGVAEINVTAVTFAAEGDLLELRIQGFENDDGSGDFATLAELRLGDYAAASKVHTDTMGVGKYRLMFSNEQNGKVWRYIGLRAVKVVNGAATVGVDVVELLS